MVTKNMSHDAVTWLNEELNKYKNEIISRVSFTEDGHEITVRELIQAKYELENYNSLYNIQIKNMIKSQRRLLYTTAISLLISFISVLYYIIADEHSVTNIELLTIVMTIISVFVATLTMAYAAIIKKKREQIPDKKMLVDTFMRKWNDFEWALKQRFMKKNAHKASSWINIMQLYLKDFDEKNPQKTKYFYEALNIRNKIVHGQLNSLSNKELAKAIEVVSELSSEFNE